MTVTLTGWIIVSFCAVAFVVVATLLALYALEHLKD